MSDIYGIAPSPPDGKRAWNWEARDPKSGKQVTFYTEPTVYGPNELLEKFKAAYRNLDFSTFKISEALNGPQKILKPIPRQYFQHGILDAVLAELRQTGEVAQPKPIRGRSYYRR